MDLGPDHIMALVAVIGIISPIVGNFIGAKLTVKFLQAAHDKFEKAVWEAFDKDRTEIKEIRDKVVRVEAYCEAHREDSKC
jgi:hypothetical protein